jgi:hypothetical protein
MARKRAEWTVQDKVVRLIKLADEAAKLRKEIPPVLPADWRPYRKAAKELDRLERWAKRYRERSLQLTSAMTDLLGSDPTIGRVRKKGERIVHELRKRIRGL